MNTETLKEKIRAMHKKTGGSIYQADYNDALVDVIKLLEADEQFTPQRFANNAVEVEPGVIELS